MALGAGTCRGPRQRARRRPSERSNRRHAGASAAVNSDPAMRQIVLDTETTGLEPELNHRVIEIGCVELVNRRATGRTFHRYLNPEREIDDGALSVHGISRTDLDEQPRFREIADELLEFLSGSELEAHEAMLALITRESGGRCLWASELPDTPAVRLPPAPEVQRAGV